MIQTLAAAWLALLALAATATAASGIQPESTGVQLTLANRSGTYQPEQPTQLASLLRDQLSRPQQRSNLIVTTLSSNQQELTTQQQNQPTTTQLPSTQIKLQPELEAVTSRPQFQYVRPVTVHQAPKCFYNNQTYSIGQRWNDDCLQVCECVSSGETTPLAISACRPRCPIYKDPPGENCTLQRSKSDECCLDWLCAESEPKLSSMLMPTTTTTTTTSAPTTTTTPTHMIERGQSSLVSAEAPKILQTSTQASTQASSVPVTSTSTVTPPTTTTTTTTTRQPTTILSTRQQPATTSSTQSTPAAPTLASVAPTTTLQSRRLPPTSSQSRNPKQAHLQATQSPRNLPPPRPQSLVTTTTNVPSLRETGARSISPVAPEMNAADQIEEADPLEHDLCIAGADARAAYRVNTSWLEEPCNQNCRCVFRNEPRELANEYKWQPTVNLKPGSQHTEIRCTLPAHCEPIEPLPAPSAECPSPRLQLPQPPLDKCACPQLVCTTPESQLNRQRGPRPTTTTTTSTLAPIVGCKSRQLGAKLLKIGETFNDECHSQCTCFETGEIRCQPLTCPPVPPADSLCAQWLIEPNFQQNSTEGHCCPTFVCKESAPRSCTLMGREIAHGQQLPEQLQPQTAAGCERVCACNDAKIVCQPLCPPLPEMPPEDLGCPASQAYKASDECCPKWACPITIEYAFEDFTVDPINATSAEVNFVLPVFALGRRGRAELNFTGLPMTDDLALVDLPPANANWQSRRNIKTADGIFSSQSVKYHMNNLKPNHKYWFKLAVHFSDNEQPLDEPMESSIQRVVMPALEVEPTVSLQPTQPPTSTTTSPTTTTTTTTTTTLTPPTRMLQPNLEPASRVIAVAPVAHGAPQSSTTTTTTTTTPSTTTTDQLASSSETTSSSSVSVSVTELPVATTTATQLPSTTTHQSTTSTTTTSTTTTEVPEFSVGSSASSSSGPTVTSTNQISDIFKPELSLSSASQPQQPQPPCSKSHDHNRIDDGLQLPWTDHFQNQMNGPLQRYAWHLLVALSTMTILFTIVFYLYLKKSTRVLVPINSQSAYDNPTFTKLVSYYANQQHVLLVDENNQNFNNDIIVARQKSLEADQTSPLHKSHQQFNDVHHHNGRQHLI